MPLSSSWFDWVFPFFCKTLQVIIWLCKSHLNSKWWVSIQWSLLLESWLSEKMSRESIWIQAIQLSFLWQKKKIAFTFPWFTFGWKKFLFDHICKWQLQSLWYTHIILFSLQNTQTHTISFYFHSLPWNGVVVFGRFHIWGNWDSKGLNQPDSQFVL